MAVLSDETDNRFAFINIGIRGAQNSRPSVEPGTMANPVVIGDNLAPSSSASNAIVICKNEDSSHAETDQLNPHFVVVGSGGGQSSSPFKPTVNREDEYWSYDKGEPTTLPFAMRSVRAA